MYRQLAVSEDLGERLVTEGSLAHCMGRALALVRDLQEVRRCRGSYFDRVSGIAAAGRASHPTKSPPPYGVWGRR